jgi:LuxR family maltose regulon positive regulatory protein
MPDDTPDGPAEPSVLLTKLRPPAWREELLTRERLFVRLRSGSDARLTLVAAPAGSGKTTLLAGWCEAERLEKPVSWLGLDERDNDPVVLWSHVLESLRGADPTLTGIPASALMRGGSITDTLLPRLANCLLDHGPRVLILDDFHRLSDGPARDSVAWFVRNAPRAVQVVVATRTEPALGLASLRARGELVEVRGEDLHFTESEASALLNGRFDLGLTADDVALLVARTEGWPAGVYLATFSLSRLDDPHEFLARFGGTSRHVVDFLSEEVLAFYDPMTLELMVACSVLGQFSGQLCDVVLGWTESAAMLTQLARSNLFVIPLDDELGWYRFHPLFSQFLSMELADREPGYAAGLHRRASLWHADHGSLDEAIEHALEGHAFEEAADMIAAAWPVYKNASRMASILAWLQRLPNEVRNADVRLLLTSAWIYSLLGLRAEAAREISAVEKAVDADVGPLPDGFSSAESGLVLLRAIFPWEDIHLQLENAKRAADLESVTSPWRPGVCWVLGWCSYLDRRLDEADARFDDATALGFAQKQWTMVTAALAYHSLSAGEQGLIVKQRLLAEQAATIGEEHGIDEINGEIHIAVGMSLAARDSPDEALPFLDRGVAGLRVFGQPLYLMHALLLRASVLTTSAGARSLQPRLWKPDPSSQRSQNQVSFRASWATSRRRRGDSCLRRAS